MGLAALLGVAAARVVSASRLAERAREEAVQALGALARRDGPAAEAHFGKARALLAAAGAKLASPEVRLASAVPVAGGNVRAARDALWVGQELAEAGAALSHALVLFPQDWGLHRGELDMAPFRAALPMLEEAGRHVDAALGASSGLPRRFLLPQVRRASSRAREAAIEASRFGSYLPLLKVLPALLGEEGERVYFIAAENPAELRGTGGFVGAYGELRVARGRISLGAFSPTVGTLNARVAKPAPLPPEISRYRRFEADRLWQNVNMTPDFPSAARVMEALYPLSGGRPIDGVLGLDPEGLAVLLRQVGPVEVPGLGKVGAAELTRFVTFEAALRAGQRRKEVLGETAMAIWSRVLSSRLRLDRGFLEALGDAVLRGHIKIHSSHPEEEAALARAGLDGGVPFPCGLPCPADYLLVVGENAAGNKVDQFVSRSLRYRVDPDPSGVLRSSLELVAANRMPSGLPPDLIGPSLRGDPPGLMRLYTSVFRAPGTLLDAVQGVEGMESEEERGLPVYSAFLLARAGEEAKLLARFVQEGGVRREGLWGRQLVYRLFVDRQPALRPDGLEVEVVAPAGWRLKEVRVFRGNWRVFGEKTIPSLEGLGGGRGVPLEAAPDGSGAKISLSLEMPFALEVRMEKRGWGPLPLP